jgi:hypothetical protein
VTDLIVVPTVLGGPKSEAPKAAEDAVVYRERDVPQEWETRLREISPISDTHSWLALRWHPAIERWFLYEMVPDQFISLDWRSELQGEHPSKLEEWARICTPYQWDMYRKHRVHARPCWIIQGVHGGHKVAFDAADQELCRAQGLPTTPPEFGSLPYAPFDERVVVQLMRRNKLVQAKNDLAEFRKRHGNTEGFKRTYRDALEKAREQYVSYLNEQLSDGDDLLRKAYDLGELDGSKRTDDDFVEKTERQDYQYIKTGRF